MRSVKVLSVVLGIFSSCAAFATVTAAPDAPYSIDSASRLYIATLDMVDGTGWVDTAAGYDIYDVTTTTSTATTNIPIYISGLPSDKTTIQVLAETSTSGTYLIVPIQANNSSTINGSAYTAPVTGYFWSVSTNSGATEGWININLAALCQASNQAGANALGCTTAGLVTQVSNTTDEWGVKLKVVPRASESTTDNTNIDGAYAFTIFPEKNRAATACIGSSPYFYPADQSILVEPGRFSFTPNSSGSSPVKSALVVMADTAAPGYAQTTWNTYDILARGNPEGEQAFGGFTNYDPATGSITYPSGVYAFRDSAGVMSSGGCVEPTMVAGEIASFLKESNCFVATASFRDENAAPVILLREFRDQVLKKFSLGRSFINFYYNDGPTAANWLLEHPSLRVVSLALLMPFQALAWIALHPSLLLIPIFSMFFFAAYFRPSLLVIFLAIGFFTARDAGATDEPKKSNSPYIDSLLSGIDSDEFKRTNENPDPYIQSLRKKLKKDQQSDTAYINELKKDLGEDDSSKDYSKRIQKELGPGDQRSAIADFRSGKKLGERRGDTTATGSFGFRIMTASNRSYDAGSAQETDYESAYGDGWTPDLLLTYEKRPFKGWAANRLGILGGFGFSWAKADATFKNALPGFGNASRTKIRFITVPVLVGLTYKFNLFDFVYPYVSAGPGVYLFHESRSDELGSSRGYSFGNFFIAGMNFGLDWTSKEASWDRFSSSGIKHTYISVEYSRQSTFSGGLIDMTVDGVAVGFNFEL